MKVKITILYIIKTILMLEKFSNFDKIDIRKELESISTSPDFLSFMGMIYDKKYYLGIDEISELYSEELSYYLSRKWGGKVAFIDIGLYKYHTLFKDGKYYDVFNPEGVEKFSELKWSKTFLKNEKIRFRDSKPNSLRGYLLYSYQIDNAVSMDYNYSHIDKILKKNRK